MESRHPRPWVVICFQISIFEPLETTVETAVQIYIQLWFAFKLVSLNHWKQRITQERWLHIVVICFQISIFEPLETTSFLFMGWAFPLWFAFKLVSLNHWKQREPAALSMQRVVICFQISIFEPLETTLLSKGQRTEQLWFAFKLVSLNHWKQLQIYYINCR